MKDIFYYKIIVLILFGALANSCTDMRDVFGEYVGDEEVVYSTKLKNPKVYPGFNRVKITGEIADPFNVNEIVIYWDERNEHKVFDYIPNKGTDSVGFYIDELEEKAYIFEVVTQGNGHYSVPVQLSAMSYGEKFRSNLEHRNIKSFLFDGENISLEFSKNVELLLFTKIVYYNTDNDRVEVLIDGDVDEVILDNVKIEESFTTQTAYLPVLNSVDTVKTDIEKYKVPEISSILNTIKINDYPTGCVVSWDNPKKQDIKIIVDYNDNLNRKTIESGKISDKIMISGMMVNDIKVTVSDLYNNAFGPVEFSFTPTETEVKLDKTDWDIFDFSSQEVTPPQFASNIIDDKLGTRWHSQYNGARPGYPHHITVDMKKQVSISRIELFKRQDVNITGFTKFEFLVSDDGSNFTSLGVFNFDRFSMAGQSFYCAGQGRYFKFLALEGASDVTNLAEINVFGAE